MKETNDFWGGKPEPHDYPAAEDYLSLVFTQHEAHAIVQSLRDLAIVRRKAKDILRASRLAPLEETNRHVRKDLEKVKAGEKLSPVLLVRGNALLDRPLIVADGFHRICASWHMDEDADIPCQIADLPATGERT